MSYSNILSSTSWAGTIGNVTVRWTAEAPDRVAGFAYDNRVPIETIKALSEHYAYATACRIGSEQVVIQGSPHENSMNSATGELSRDDLHISVRATGGGVGQNNVHIYLDGIGSGSGAYDNVYVKAETVLKRNKKKGGYVMDRSLSYGGMGLATGPAAITSGGSQVESGSSGQGAAYSEWELDTESNRHRRFNYASQRWEWTAGQSGGGMAGGPYGGGTNSEVAEQTVSYSDWEWDPTYGKHRRFNYSTQGWEWQ